MIYLSTKFWNFPVKGNLCFILQKLAQFSDVYASKLIPFQALNAPGNSATPTSNFARSHVEIFCKSLCPIFEDMERALSIVDGIWSEGYHNTIKKVYEDMQKGAKDSKFRPFFTKSSFSPYPRKLSPSIVLTSFNLEHRRHYIKNQYEYLRVYW